MHPINWLFGCMHTVYAGGGWQQLGLLSLFLVSGMKSFAYWFATVVSDLSLYYISSFLVLGIGMAFGHAPFYKVGNCLFPRSCLNVLRGPAVARSFISFCMFCHACSFCVYALYIVDRMMLRQNTLPKYLYSFIFYSIVRVVCVLWCSIKLHFATLLSISNSLTSNLFYLYVLRSGHASSWLKFLCRWDL